MTAQKKATASQAVATKHPFKSAALIIATCAIYVRARAHFHAALATVNLHAWDALIFSTGVQFGMTLALLFGGHA